MNSHEVFLKYCIFFPPFVFQMLSTVLNIIIFEDCRNQWSMSRPLLGLILLNEKVGVGSVFTLAYWKSHDYCLLQGPNAHVQGHSTHRYSSTQAILCMFQYILFIYFTALLVSLSNKWPSHCATNKLLFSRTIHAHKDSVHRAHFMVSQSIHLLGNFGAILAFGFTVSCVISGPYIFPIYCIFATVNHIQYVMSFYKTNPCINCSVLNVTSCDIVVVPPPTAEVCAPYAIW